MSPRPSLRKEIQQVTATKLMQAYLYGRGEYGRVMLVEFERRRRSSPKCVEPEFSEVHLPHCT
jgi:hypothetical protein